MRPVGGLGQMVEEIDDELTPCQVIGYGCWAVPEPWPGNGLVCEACGEVLDGWTDQADDVSLDDGNGGTGLLVEAWEVEEDAYRP